MIDPRTQAACASIAHAPEIALALSEAYTSGVDQSVRNILLEWGTRQIGARAAWDGTVKVRSRSLPIPPFAARRFTSLESMSYAIHALESVDIDDHASAETFRAADAPPKR